LDDERRLAPRIRQCSADADAGADADADADDLSS
jgi:hypothetical protein